MRPQEKRILLLSIAVGSSVVLAFVLSGLSTLKRRAAAIDCAGTMSAICFAANMWSQQHEGRFPLDLMSMSNELNTPKILICQGDRTRKRASDWSSYTPANSSYAIVSPTKRDDTNSVFLRCMVHNHQGFTDTTVYDGIRPRHKYARGGASSRQ